MKIALLHDSILPPLHYGGIERIVMSLADQYTRLGHSVVIAGRRGSKITDYEFVAVPEDHDSRDAKSYLPSDVEFVHSHQPLSIQPSLPHLVTIHGNGKPNEKYLPNTNFVSLSHARNHGSKIYVYNGIDTGRFPLVEKKENYFVFLAKAKWRVKNLRTCIDLARDLGVRLEVIGGMGRSNSTVRYHGSIGENGGKLEILSRAKALLYPTNWEEPFGLAVVEALACGTPVIASSNGAMPEIVDSKVGFVCTNYYEFLAAGQSIGRMQAKACRARVEEKFTSEKMALGYLELITQIVREHELAQTPHYAFDRERLTLLYKPTMINRLKHSLLGKV